MPILSSITEILNPAAESNSTQAPYPNCYGCYLKVHCLNTVNGKLCLLGNNSFSGSNTFLMEEFTVIGVFAQE